MPQQRVQKIIAAHGLCSRRAAEELIRQGRVTVNGSVAELGAKADPEHDHVKVDGRLLSVPEERRYVLLYKPREVMTTCDDPQGRATVLDLIVPAVRERVFPVGRLDYQSEGLLILTNDGDLAARVTHPRYGLVREYLVKVRGDLHEASIRRLLRGAVVEGRRVKPINLRREGPTGSGRNTWWRIEVGEGRTHEVRELFFRAGHPVQRLRRTAIGPIRDDAMRPGHFRDLSAAEVRALRAASRTPAARRPRSARSGSDRKTRPK